MFWLGLLVGMPLGAAGLYVWALAYSAYERSRYVDADCAGGSGRDGAAVRLMPAYTNARQHMPKVFRHIIDSDRELTRLRDDFVSGEGTTDDWHRVRELHADRKNLRAGAERALRWNTDKGATP
jgi:hypothetical protein